MSSLVSTPQGLVPINGPASGIINDASKANSGTPGQPLIPHPGNIVDITKRITIPVADCNSVESQQRLQQRLNQRAMQGIVQSYLGLIEKEIQKQLTSSSLAQNLSQQVENLTQQIQQIQASGVEVPQDLLLSQELSIGQLGQVLAGVSAAAIVAVAKQNPVASQVVERATQTSTAAITKSVVERIVTVPQTQISTNYARSRAVQTISQACSF